MKLEVNIQKRYAFFIFTGILILASVFAVYAYKSGQAPNVFGHSAEEVEITLGNGSVVNLQQLIANGLGNGSSTVVVNNPSQFRIINGSVTLTMNNFNSWNSIGNNVQIKFESFSAHPISTNGDGSDGPANYLYSLVGSGYSFSVKGLQNISNLQSVRVNLALPPAAMSSNVSLSCEIGGSVGNFGAVQDYQSLYCPCHDNSGNVGCVSLAGIIGNGNPTAGTAKFIFTYLN